jgi:signal transduction histidine kinase
VIRHANATRVEINLGVKDGVLWLEIMDNGRGIPEEAVSNPTSFGLIGIKERVHSLVGEVDIAGTQHGGTRVIVTIPIS